MSCRMMFLRFLASTDSMVLFWMRLERDCPKLGASLCLLDSNIVRASSTS